MWLPEKVLLRSRGGSLLISIPCIARLCQLPEAWRSEAAMRGRTVEPEDSGVRGRIALGLNEPVMQMLARWPSPAVSREVQVTGVLLGPANSGGSRRATIRRGGRLKPNQHAMGRFEALSRCGRRTLSRSLAKAWKRGDQVLRDGRGGHGERGGGKSSSEHVELKNIRKPTAFAPWFKLLGYQASKSIKLIVTFRVSSIHRSISSVGRAWC